MKIPQNIKSFNPDEFDFNDKEQVKTLFFKLFNVVETQAKTIEKLKQENQQLKDEIQVRKENLVLSPMFQIMMYVRVSGRQLRNGRKRVRKRILKLIVLKKFKLIMVYFQVMLCLRVIEVLRFRISNL